MTQPLEQFNHLFATVFSDWDVLKDNGSKGESLLSLGLYDVQTNHTIAILQCK